MKTFLQNIMFQISSFLNGLGKKEEKKDPNTKTRLNDLYDDIPDPAIVFKEALGMQDIDRDSQIPENLKKILLEIENMGNRLRKFGESDGPFQMRYKTIRIIANNTAERVSKYIETIFKGISESLKSEAHIKEDEEKRIIKDLEVSKKYLGELKQTKHWQAKNYILWEALIYLVFGIALLTGDIVLSLSGTKEAFLLQDWEAVAMSFGITACSIYIKMYYDDYILSALERSVTRYKQENLIGIEDDSSKSKLKRVWQFRLGLKTILLLFVLLSIYLLGELRFEVISEINPSVGQHGFSRITFVLLSALFPVIGGVCMAMAIKKFRSHTIYRKAYKEEKRIQSKLYKLQKEKSTLDQDIENCNTYIKWSTNDEFIKNLTEFLYACYLHGYEYASRKHNAQLDKIEKAKEIRRLFSGNYAKLNNEYPF